MRRNAGLVRHDTSLIANQRRGDKSSDGPKVPTGVILQIVWRRTLHAIWRVRTGRLVRQRGILYAARD